MGPDSIAIIIVIICVIVIYIGKILFSTTSGYAKTHP